MCAVGDGHCLAEQSMALAVAADHAVVEAVREQDLMTVCLRICF